MATGTRADDARIVETWIDKGDGMRRCKRDANHARLVDQFVALGCTVMETDSVGIAGFPDLVVGCIGRNHLVEVKNPETRYGRSGLNDNQQTFNRDWRGQGMAMVSTEDEVTALVQNWRRGNGEHA